MTTATTTDTNLIMWSHARTHTHTHGTTEQKALLTHHMYTQDSPNTERAVQMAKGICRNTKQESQTS